MEFSLVITSTLALKQINHQHLCWTNQSLKVSFVFNMFAYAWSCKNCSHYRINVYLYSVYSILVFGIFFTAPTASSKGVNVPPTYINCYSGLMSLNNQNIINNLTGLQNIIYEYENQKERQVLIEMLCIFKEYLYPFL